MERLFKKLLLFTTLSAFLLLQSCGSEDKSKESTKESNQDTNAVSLTTQAEPPALVLPALPKFKITRQQLIDINNNHPNTKKLILQTGFANFNDPTTIKLYYYHTDNHKNYARNQTPSALGIDTDAGTVPDLDDEFILGNCEINFKELKKELMTGGAWENFSHLRLTPAIKNINNKGYFSYDIELIGEDGVKIMMAVPVDTKPSPPAPPDPED